MVVLDSDAKYQTIFQALPDGIFTTDEEGVIELFNELLDDTSPAA